MDISILIGTGLCLVLSFGSGRADNRKAWIAAGFMAGVTSILLGVRQALRTGRLDTFLKYFVGTGAVFTVICILLIVLGFEIRYRNL